MRNTQRRINLAVGVVQAVSVAGLVFLIAFGLVTQKPWWLVLGPSLALPEIALGALATLRDLRAGAHASTGGGLPATRALSAVGIMLMLCGFVFWS